jgi:hypothetical protein
MKIYGNEKSPFELQKDLEYPIRCEMNKSVESDCIYKNGLPHFLSV